MSRGRTIILALAIVAGALAAGSWWHNREPACHGHPATFWLEAHAKAGFRKDSPAAKVLKDCGEDLTPYLRKVLRKRISPIRYKVMKYLPKKHERKFAPGSLYGEHTRALKALQLMGVEAGSAAPELLGFFKPGHSASLQFEVYMAFQAMGMNGEEILARNLEHEDGWVRFHCATALLFMDPKNEAGRNTLIELKSHSNDWLAGVASNSSSLLHKRFP